MQKLLRFIIIIIVFTQQSAYALDLQEALAAAYCKNNDLQNIRNKFLLEIEQFSDAFSGFLPAIQYGITSQTSNATLIKNIAPISPSRKQKTIQKNFSINQPIFNGGGSVADLKAAQAAFRAARASYYSKEQQVILSLIKTFLDCYAAKEKYEITEASVKANQRQLDTVQEKLNLGEATQIDLQTARTGLYIAETNKLTAYASYQTIRANFARMFGVEPNNLILPILTSNCLTCREKLIQDALNRNFDIESAKHAVQARKAVELSAKSNLLPTVSFNVQHGRVHYATQELQLGQDDNKSITTSVSINIPIYQRGTEYTKIRRAKNGTREAAIQLDDTIKKTRASSLSSWEVFEAAKSKITSTTQAVEAAKISYDGTLQEEIVGSKTVLDVLNAQQNLYNAELDKVDAYNESLNTYYQIKSLLGELTARALKLKVKYFDPDNEFKYLRRKLIIGL